METLKETWKLFLRLFSRTTWREKNWNKIIYLLKKELKRVNLRIEYSEKIRNKINKNFLLYKSFSEYNRSFGEKVPSIESVEKIRNDSYDFFSGDLLLLAKNKDMIVEILKKRDLLYDFYLNLNPLYIKDFITCLSGHCSEKKIMKGVPFKMNYGGRLKRQLMSQKNLWIKYYYDNLSQDDEVKKKAEIPEKLWWKEEPF